LSEAQIIVTRMSNRLLYKLIIRKPE